MRTCARADVAHFPYLGNGWTDCAEVWCVARDPLAKLLQEFMVGHSCTRTCALLFRISETAGRGRTALKFGMWLEAHYLSVLQKLMLGLGTCARAAVPGTAVRVHVRIPFPYLGNG